MGFNFRDDIGLVAFYCPINNDKIDEGEFERINETVLCWNCAEKTGLDFSHSAFKAEFEDFDYVECGFCQKQLN